MANEAPVCHIPPEVNIPQPTASVLPTIPMPDATIPGMLAAVHALKQYVEILGGQRRTVIMNQFGKPAPNQKNPRGGRFTELSRSIKTERVFNKDDKSQFVDVDFIQTLTMRDTVTGEVWTWER